MPLIIGVTLLPPSRYGIFSSRASHLGRQSHTPISIPLGKPQSTVSSISFPHQRKHTPFPAMSKTGIDQPAQISRGLCSRLAEWLWPGRGSRLRLLSEPPSPSASSHGADTHAGRVAPDNPHPPRVRLQIEPRASVSLDCKACRERGMVCNQVRPQCEQCYEQQTLCFYVSPSFKGQRQKRTRRADRVLPQVNADETTRSACVLACAATGD
ncbi:Fungal Zn(2)-Cys(6) binuclear cluster domain-containing protein [Penicillium ucsense]|uniref:Fungal Zn(2)-Cys(6) binuclear cluster domain-containing protein n=1 Tax=Penicillium ucsense TaxID=2839758 RepID=A0A8J8W803_9EURO|nr:Fungal Zn(2)-Cys(6) binuclear cluster domain-containing protein [Penicillium ucsense]KAF7733767.1 Fungal Zn(2)-Cys(6) binuclear cluster domain-containing protein [Penicillium ucsense]